jgi:hypothetical protein
LLGFDDAGAADEKKLTAPDWNLTDVEGIGHRRYLITAA